MPWAESVGTGDVLLSGGPWISGVLGMTFDPSQVDEIIAVVSPSWRCRAADLQLQTSQTFLMIISFSDPLQVFEFICYYIIVYMM